MKETKREFQRVFEFIVKYNNGVIPWPNAKLKNFIRWAWFYRKLFIVYDGPRIAGLGVAWRTDHPENNLDDLSIEKTESGDFLHICRVIIHPDYRSRGIMFQLLVLASLRYSDIKKVFWEKRSKTPDQKPRMMIISLDNLFKELYKWQAKTQHQHLLKSKLKA